MSDKQIFLGVSGRINILVKLVFLSLLPTLGEGLYHSAFGTLVFQEKLSLPKICLFKDLWR